MLCRSTGERIDSREKISNELRIVIARRFDDFRPAIGIHYVAWIQVRDVVEQEWVQGPDQGLAGPPAGIERRL